MRGARTDPVSVRPHGGRAGPGSIRNYSARGLIKRQSPCQANRQVNFATPCPLCHLPWRLPARNACTARRARRRLWAAFAVGAAVWAELAALPARAWAEGAAFLAGVMTSPAQIVAHGAAAAGIALVAAGALARTMMPLRWLAVGSNLGLLV